MHKLLEYFNSAQDHVIQFFDQNLLDDISTESGFFAAKEKYLKSYNPGSVYQYDRYKRIHRTLNEGSVDEFITKARVVLGDGVVNAELGKLVTPLTHSDLQAVSKGLILTVQDGVKRKAAEFSFRDHSLLFNSIMKVNAGYTDMKDFLPISFENVAKNIGIFGYSIHDENKGAAHQNTLFKLIGSKMTKIMDDCIERGKANPPEYISFSSSGATGCVCSNEKIWKGSYKYNFVYDSLIKVSMYRELAKMSKSLVIDIVNHTFKVVGSRYSFYNNIKRKKRLTMQPVKKLHEPFYFNRDYNMEEGTQLNEHNGFTHRPVAGVASSLQYHGSHHLQLYYAGLDGIFKQWVKFTPESLIISVNDIYKKSGRIPIAFDVANSEFRVDSHAVIDMLFKQIQNGLFSDVADAVYNNTHTVGIYGSKLDQLIYYIQKCGTPDRFISGWIFTGFGNAWFYLTIQVIHEVLYEAVLAGVISKNNAWNISEKDFIQVYEKHKDTMMFFNQGDDMLVFVDPDSIDVYTFIVESNPFCLIEKEEEASMSGMLIVDNSPEQLKETGDKFRLATKLTTVLLKSSEKMEGRNYTHPLRSNIIAGIVGKFDLIKSRPILDIFSDSEKAVSVYAKTLNINVANLREAVLLNLADMMFAVENEPEKFAKSIVINKLMEKFQLNSSNEIYWKLTSDEIANSGIEGVEDLFILLPFYEGIKGPFF